MNIVIKMITNTNAQIETLNKNVCVCVYIYIYIYKLFNTFSCQNVFECVKQTITSANSGESLCKIS